MTGARDTVFKQFAGGNLHRLLEEAATELAYYLEELGHMAVVLPSLLLDFKQHHPEDNCPAGQGSRFMRLAAVEAGLGTLGLNLMLLTPEFGPRVFLSAVMTDLALSPDEPLTEELCLGLEQCGRCAAICPEDAIPRRAPVGAPLASYRGLDGEPCARSSQPYGVGTYVEHIRALLKARSPQEVEEKVRSPMTARIWQNMAVLRQGAFTGCMACLQVCPVGGDYEVISRSPHRRRDLPDGVTRRVADGVVEVIHVGPAPENRGGPLAE